MTSETGAWMPMYWSDYFGKTTHLTTEEHGAYLLLIGAYWQRARALPDDDAFLATVTKVSRKRWRIMRQKISDFFVISDGAWTHDRVEKEILRSTERLNSARANGRAGGLAKSKLPTSHIHNGNGKEKGKIRINGFGKGRDGVTISDPQERLVRFQKKLAESFDRDGWLIVSAAADPSSPEHFRALELCKAKAKQIGKGWPTQWPSN